MITERECPICGGDMEEKDSGGYKGYIWNTVECIECGHIESDEPDWDSMPGGHDYY